MSGLKSIANLFLNTESLRLRSTLLHYQTRNIKRWVAPTLRELRKRKNKLGAEPEHRRSSFIEWNYNAECFAFGKRLHENFDMKILHQAFTSRSYIVQEELNQRSVGIDDPKIDILDNNMLVEAGHSVLSDYIKVYLEKSLPKFPADGIDAVRKHLLSDKVLFKISNQLGIKDLILSAEYPPHEQTQVNAFKAVIAALVKSSGIQKAQIFIRDFVCTQLNQEDINTFWRIENPIELLQELCEKKKLAKPEPRLIAESGTNTVLSVYQVGMYCDKKLIGTGFGENVDVAIEVAARNSLANFFGTESTMKPFNYEMFLNGKEKKTAIIRKQ